MNKIEVPNGWPKVIETGIGGGKSALLLKILRDYGVQGLEKKLEIGGVRENPDDIRSLGMFYSAIQEGLKENWALVLTQLEYMGQRFLAYKEAMEKYNGVFFLDRCLEGDRAFYKMLRNSRLINEQVYGALVVLNDFFSQKIMEMGGYGEFFWLGTGSEESDRNSTLVAEMCFGRAKQRKRAIEKIKDDVKGPDKEGKKEKGGLTLPYEIALVDQYEAEVLPMMEKRGILRRVDYRTPLPTEMVDFEDYQSWKQSYDGPLNFDNDHILLELPPNLYELFGLAVLEKGLHK